MLSNSDDWFFRLQWWPMVVSNFWAMFSVPPAQILATTVAIVNLGGVFNCIAYTVIRRRLQQQNSSQGPQVVLSNGSRSEVIGDSGSDFGGSTTTLSSVVSNNRK
jgi:hypothetical protein